MIMEFVQHGASIRATEVVMEAHRRVMVANQSAASGSQYIASQIYEAKDMLLRRTKAVPSYSNHYFFVICYGLHIVET